MPDIAGLLKSEIARLSKKAVRQGLAPLRSASASHRHQLASLKKQVQALDAEVAKLRRQAGPRAAPAAAPAEGDGKVRFVAKGLQSLRSRLGLSAEDFGRLVGVSGQSVYHWEAKKTVPRPAQVLAIKSLRGIGKKEAQARLEALAAEGSKKA